MTLIPYRKQKKVLIFWTTWILKNDPTPLLSAVDRPSNLALWQGGSAWPAKARAFFLIQKHEGRVRPDLEKPATFKAHGGGGGGQD